MTRTCRVTGHKCQSTGNDTADTVTLVTTQLHRLCTNTVGRHHLDVETVARVDVTLRRRHEHVLDQRHRPVDRQWWRRVRHVRLVLEPNLTTKQHYNIRDTKSPPVTAQY